MTGPTGRSISPTRPASIRSTRGGRDAGEWIVARERERLGSAADRQRTGEMRVVDEDGRDGIGWAAVAGAGTSGSAVDAYASMSPRRMA
jgi:hypothetical protein